MSNKNLIEVVNEGGISGNLKVSDGMAFDLKPPTLSNPSDQLSPKHLMAMAWSTCLNATIMSVFRQNKIDNASRVRVSVEQKVNEKEGLHYVVIAYVAIEGYDEKQTMKIAKIADRLCPISKLITKNEFVSLEYEVY